MSRTLDDVLNDAWISSPEADDDEEGERAAYRRVIDDYEDAVARGSGGGFPESALSDVEFRPYGTAPSPRRERAARELRTLASLTVRTPHAADRIQALAATHEIDPDGAFVFACLLHLADRDEQAEFLWQFSAGAGKPVSAECLSLLHTTRGELRTARHWAAQVADLERAEDRSPCRAAAPAGAPGPLTSLMFLRIWRALRGDQAGGRLTMAAFHTCAGTLSRAMTATIQALQPEPGLDEWDLMPWPDRRLAAQMHQCLI